MARDGKRSRLLKHSLSESTFYKYKIDTSKSSSNDGGGKHKWLFDLHLSLTGEFVSLIIIGMMAKVLAKKIKQDTDYIYLKIRRDTLEAFCDAAGLYRQEFLDLLDQSEKDHRAGRVTKRNSLHDIITKKMND